MDIGIVGVGRMGGGIARRLLADGHRCVVFDRSPAAVEGVVAAGAVAAPSLAEMVAQLSCPRAIWLMLPAGGVTDEAVNRLSSLLARGDTLIDGGNGYWKDAPERALELERKGIAFLDVGTSGGVGGERRGFCLMIGGPETAVRWLQPIFNSLALAGSNGGAYIHAGPNGAGHFVKMVHNGIEYGMMQAMAEGFDILRQAPSQLGAAFDLSRIAETWRHGSVVSSWLLDLLAEQLAEDPLLRDFSGVVDDSGEGRWTIQTAIEQGVAADVLSAALFARFRTRDVTHFSGKVLSAMRKGFGGHVEAPAAELVAIARNPVRP
ncbi:decarboxylating 6-phosphogluconate dehydrogenase [Sphingomonas sp. ID1715]|uniref:phosphogluconate dehydrogenase (NAD(+)-dependent, decarboxylating) n=1 Tax=Sphingomonas sp. ID1715 TaxID=1656898 RepID=UPI00148788AF|nr:decarboxylating 6-phosphogluconate dehydrogenase [Sphingomonas sp. ID1715]NNM77757.1 decarboxylating 6-phosphogluconate dehydrogenase [Sphingomonas sp. ID1715]